jgi:hypothetical protein
MEASTVTPQEAPKKSSKKWCLIVLIPIILIVASCGICLLVGWLNDLKNNDRSLIQRSTSTPFSTSTPAPTPSPTPFIISSQRLNDILQKPPKNGTAHIFGVVRWGDLNISQITDHSPFLWMRDDKTYKPVDYPREYDPATGEFVIANVPFGKYAFMTKVGSTSSSLWPGDFSETERFSLEDTSPQSNLAIIHQIRQVIHLKSPVDNSREIENQDPLDFEQSITFSWDPVDRAVSYEIRVLEIGSDMSYRQINSIPVSNTTYTLSDLEPNDDEHNYGVSLIARDEHDIEIGFLFINYYQGFSSWYEFRIR